VTPRTCTLCLVLAVLFTVSARSEGWWQSGSALPPADWRDAWADDGVSFGGSFDSYFFGNPLGGEAQGFAYTQSLYFQLEADLEKLAGWKGGSLVWSWADNAGRNLSNTVGNEFQIVGAYGPNTFYFDLLSAAGSGGRRRDADRAGGATDGPERLSRHWSGQLLCQ